MQPEWDDSAYVLHPWIARYIGHQVRIDLTVAHVSAMGYIDNMNSEFPIDLVQSFTEGDCWVLAMSVHKATGWTIVAVGACEEDPVEETVGGPDWVHMAVRTPTGTIVDVEGIHTDEEKYLERWWDAATDRYCEPDVYLFDVTDRELFDSLTIGQGHVPLYDNYSHEILAGVVDRLVELGSGQN